MKNHMVRNRRIKKTSYYHYSITKRSKTSTNILLLSREPFRHAPIKKRRSQVKGKSRLSLLLRLTYIPELPHKLCTRPDVQDQIYPAVASKYLTFPILIFKFLQTAIVL